MAKNYVVKWYDWHASHYNEKECTSEQLNKFFFKIKQQKRDFRYYNNGGKYD